MPKAAGGTSNIKSNYNARSPAASNGLSRMPTSTPTSYAGPKGANQLNDAARMAAARSVGYNAPPVQRTPGDSQALGRMMMAESRNIKNPMGGINTTALQGVGDVVRNRMVSGQYPATAQGVMAQPKQFSPMQDGGFARTPVDHSATSVAESILSGETPSVVGNALNYGNLDTIRNKPGYSSQATKRAFASMEPVATFTDAQNPKIGHSFGTIGEPSGVTQANAVAQPLRGLPQVAAAAPQTQSETAPSFWEQGKELINKGLVRTAWEGFTDANKQINAVPGGAKTVTGMGRLAQALQGGPTGYTPPASNEQSGGGLARLPPAQTPQAGPVVVQKGPQFSWVQWQPGQPPVQVPNAALTQGMA